MTVWAKYLEVDFFGEELLGYVTNKHLADLDKLPTADELWEVYSADPLVPCVDSIIMGYNRKIDLPSE